MATPSGNSPSFPASTQESGRNNKRKHEDCPATYEQYLQLKKQFLNCHARVCDICKSLIYGSRKAPQLEHACDSHLNSLTETQVGDMILVHLDLIYRKVIEDLSSNHGYPEVDATTAVLATGICYGCEDPIGNALKHALTFLECGLRVDKIFPEDLKTLVKFVSMIIYDGWRKKYPYLCMDDFLLWLLVYRKDPSDASTLASYPFIAWGSHQVSSCSTCLQCKEESTSNTSTIQFMPKASVTEDHKLEPKLTSATGIPGSASARFTARTSPSLRNSNPNAAKKNPMSASDSLAGKFSSLTISESSIPEEKSLYANSKDEDSSRRGFTHCLPERRRQARLVGTARMLVTKSTMLDSNCPLPKLDKKVSLEWPQSFGTIDFSFDAAGSFACSSFSMNMVNTTTSLSHAANVDAFTSISSKSRSDDASIIADCNLAIIPYLLEKLHSRSKHLQFQLQYWTKWAHHKVLQTTNKLNEDKPELQRLRQEKLEAKKEAAAFADSTMKKIGEMDKALPRSKAQVEAASADIRKLEFEKIRLEEKLEAAKLRASESAANYEEASSKEIMTLKKSQTCERERALFQEELVSEKRVLSQLLKRLQQAQMSHGQLEVFTSWFIVCYFFSGKYFRVYYYLYI